MQEKYTTPLILKHPIMVLKGNIVYTYFLHKQNEAHSITVGNFSKLLVLLKSNPNLHT